MLKVMFWTLFIAFDIVGLMSMSHTNKNGEYTVEAEQLTAVVEWGEDITLEDIKIVDNRLFGWVETTLTEDMIVSIDDTATAGQKKIVFEHNNKQFTVVFDVKYKVEFVSYGNVIDTQLVVTPDELVLPEPVAKTGYEFSHWDYDFSAGISENIQVNAVFKETDYPPLTAIYATYGDTIGGFVLPMDERGRWEFLDAPDTLVGDAGSNYHIVRFVFNDDDSYYKYSEVEIRVSKRQLDFTIDSSDTFVYDGESHFPSYSLDREVAEVFVTGGAKTDVGTYNYILEIVDDNYYGEYTGSFKIVKPTVTVNVSSAEMEYRQQIPEFTYTVEGFENVDLLGIEITTPERTATIGEYEVGITYTNDNVDYIINKGTLTVIPTDLPASDIPVPEYSAPTFGDKLSDIEFIGSYLGTWTWESPDTVVDDINGITAYAIFTPQSVNYNPERVEISITGVKKKQLTITVIESEFTYAPGGEYKVIYQIEGTDSSIQVDGNDPVYTALSESRTLMINDPRYTGQVTVTLTVHKAIPSTDFTNVYTPTWSEGLILSSVQLPDGYTWKNPSLVITAGEHICDVIYTPDDTTNYEIVNGQIKVVVGKANPEFAGVEDLYEKIYDGDKFDIKKSGISVYYTDGAVSIEYYKDGVLVDEIINAGTYTVRITVSEGSNYLGRTIERTATVTPAANPQTVLDNQTATYGDSLSVLKLPADMQGSWSWLETEIGNAGTRTFTAVYTPDENGNYAPCEVEITVTVKKKPISVPSISYIEYTGEQLDDVIGSTDEYTVSGDLNPTDVGTYTVYVTLSDPANYEWFGKEDSVTVPVSYRVSEAPNFWENEPSDVSVIFNGNPVYVSGTVVYGGVDIKYYDLSGNEISAPTNAGKYKAVVTSTDPNYDELVKEVTIEITKQSVALPTIGTFTYNGREQGITITDANLNSLYTIDSEAKGTNAGSVLYVVLKLSNANNYAWETTAEPTVKLTATIGKATIAFNTGMTVSKESWIYNESEAIFTAATLDTASIALGATVSLKYSTDNVNFIYSFSDLPKTNGKLNAGTYYVKTVAATSDNWNALSTDSVKFVVNQATPDSIEVTWSGSPMVQENGNDVFYQNLLTISSYTVKYNGTAIPVTLGTWGPDADGFVFAGANTVYTFNVTPVDPNYASTGLTVNVPLKTVATIGLNGTAYGSIEDALNAAASGDTVWVRTDITGNVYIKEDVTVKSGVTLLIPYGNASDATGRNQSDTASIVLVSDNKETTDVDESEYYVMANTLPEKYMQNWVKIASGVTLKVAGTLEISGEMCGGGGGTMSGHTAGKYATLELEGDAKIEATGIIKCYGFIENVSGNLNGKITLKAGSAIYVPFVLYDFKGGTIMSGIYYDLDEHSSAPFHQFGFPNISTAFRFEYGAEMIVMCNLEANNTTNHTNAKFIGTSDKHFLQLTNSTYSYIEAKYDPLTKITDLDIYGGANLNSFSLSLKILFLDLEVSSSEFVLGLTWLYDITLDNAEGQSEAVFNMPDRYKLMPGAKFVVEKGAVLNIGALTVYDDTFVDVLSGYQANVGVYPTVYPTTSSLAGTKLASGFINVRGTLNATALAGNVHTDSDGAVIKVSGETTIVTYEPTVITKGTLSGSVDDVQTITKTLKLIYTDSNGNAINTVSSIFKGVLYTSTAAQQTWSFDIMESSFDLVLKDGYGVYAPYAVLTDANGNPYIGVYDSRTGKQNGTVRVMNNTSVTFYLTKTQLLVLDGSTTVNVSSTHQIFASGDSYEVQWTATSAQSPVVYHVPKISVSGDYSSYTVTYYNLSESNVPGNSTAYAVVELTRTYQKNKYDITLSLAISGIDSSKVTAVTGSYEGGKYNSTGSGSATVKVRIEVDEANSGASIVATQTVEETEQSSGGNSGGCVAPETLITLADGTQVRVDSLTGDEMLLVWNLETGKFDFAPIMFVDSEPMGENEVVYLYFSDGTVVKVIYEHGFWDYDLNRYIYLDTDASDYIGHYFAKQNGDELAKVQLVDVEIKTEMITAWSPVTVGHLCYFVNGVLSMPGGVGGLFNIFDVDADTMTYDFEAMANDIEAYGLFTYEELNALCPLSEDMFVAAGGAYLKISIAKGNLTVEELVNMITRYSVYFE